MKPRLLHFIPVCVMLAAACAVVDGEDTRKKPKVITVFACSDYCPGPKERYLRRAYDGISDEETCETIGGTPHVILGWGSQFICLAE